MSDTPGRLLRLLSLLQKGRELTGADLAGRLGVSVRTVRRDVDRLRDLGYPVDATIGALGGYRLVAGTAMPPLLLDDEEAVAIAAGLHTAAGEAGTGLQEATLRALAKLEQVLPERLRRRVEAVGEASEGLTGMPRGGTPYAAETDAEVLLELATACRRNGRLRFTYSGKDGRTARRHVDPYRLVHADRRWYLVAYDLDRGDWRTFRVDRVADPAATGARAGDHRLPTADAAAFVTESILGVRARYRATVLLHTGIEDAARRVPDGTGVLEAVTEGTCLLRTGGDALDWLAVRLALLGVPFEVREPLELAGYLRELGTRLVDAAG